MKIKPTLLLLSLCASVAAAFADVEQTLNNLIPKLAAPKVEDRYAPQMELQALAANAARPGAEAERAALAKLLAAKAADPSVPQPAKVWLVRQLEYIGGAESVPVLTALLKSPDAELKECARRALEKNAAPAATASLRAALEQGGDTSWKIGLVQSLGERRDSKSVTLIAPFLNSPKTSFAAASALAKIASPSAIKDLWAALDGRNPDAANALVAAANHLLAKGNSKSANAIYSRLWIACDSAQLRAAALIGLAKTDPAAGRKLISQVLAGDDLKLQDAALTAAREVYGKKTSAELAALLPNLKTSAKIIVLRVLDPSAERQVILVAAEPDTSVKIAAFETLGRIGSSASVPLLVKTAAEDPSEPQKTARTALTRISGPGSDAAISKLAADGDAKSRATAISALAARNDKHSIPALLVYATEPDPAVSGAACSALAKMGSDQELEALAKLALAGTSPGADGALQAIAGRVRNRSAAVAALVALSQSAQPAHMATLFDTLAVLGGDEALAALAKSASSTNPEAKDAAIHVLAHWPDFAAVKPLLAIAADPNAKRAQCILVLQGVVRLVRSSDNDPADARVDAALAALNAATRDEEKKLALSALASVPSPKAAEAIKPFLSEPPIKADAGLAGITLAEILLKSDKPAAKHLAQAVKDADISADLSGKADALLRK